MSTLLQLVQVRSTRALDMMAYLRAVVDRPDRLEIRLPWVGNRLPSHLFVDPDVLMTERRIELERLDKDPHGDDKSRGGANQDGDEPSNRRDLKQEERIGPDALDAEEDAVFGERWRQTEKRVPWTGQWQEAQRHGNSWRAVLLGAPGAGKSTLADMTAQALARTALTGLEDQTADLDELSLPVIVALKHLVECDDSQGSADLLRQGLQADLVMRAALPQAQADRLAERLIARLDDPRTFVLLDGLDEVEPQAPVIARLFDAASKWKCRLILTARTYGYKAWSLPFDALQEYRLAPLNLDQARAVLGKWILGEGRRKRIDDLLTRNRAVQQMSQNPFLLSLILAVGEQSDLPAQITRTQLYGRAVEMALGGKDRADEWMPLLEELAWVMWKKNPRNPRIDGRELLDIIDSRRGHLDGPAKVLRDELSRKRRLLVPEGKGRPYVFPHRSIPAFLAACHLAVAVNRQGWSEATVKVDPWKKDACHVGRFVDAAAWDPECELLVQFFAGRLDDPRPMLEALQDKTRDDLFRHRLCLAGTCLPEVWGRVEGDASTSPKFQQRIDELRETIAADVFSFWWEKPHGHRHFAHVKEAMGNIATPKLLERLAGLLGDRVWEVRSAAAEAVGNLGSAAATPAILERLIGLTGDGMPHTVHLALRGLSSLSGVVVTPATLDLLASLLGDKDSDVRYDAADVVAGLGSVAATPAILERLAGLLGDKDLYSRHAVVWAVSGLRGAAATPAFLERLAELLGDEDEDVRLDAIRVLDSIGSAAETPAILERLALAFRRQGSAAATSTFPMVRFGGLMDKSSALGSAETSAFRERVTGALLKEDSKVRHPTVEAVGNLGGAAATPAILERLADLLDDEHSYLQSAAADALDRLANKVYRMFRQGNGSLDIRTIDSLSADAH